MLPRIIATISLVSLCALSAMLTFTSPSTAGPFGLLVIFITAYLSFMGLISFFLFGISHLVANLLKGAAAKKPMRPMEFRKAYYLSTVLAAAPVMLIGLQSVHQVGIYEFALVILFEIIACVYVSKRI